VVTVSGLLIVRILSGEKVWSLQGRKWDFYCQTKWPL